MLRPIPGASQYRTHLDGLYMCGAGTHPGGGLTEFQEKMLLKLSWRML